MIDTRRCRLRELKSLAFREKASILKRDNYTCQIPGCGRKVDLQVHHIDGEFLDPTKEAYNDPINLITVDSHCHNYLTSGELECPVIYTTVIMPVLKAIAAANEKKLIRNVFKS